MYYKDAFTQWSEKIAVKLKNKERERTIVVAIARKGPRLCELEHTCIEKSLKYEHIISEHAIPFSLSDFINSLVILTDEAVYFGTTFQRIYTVLKTGISLFHTSSIPQNKMTLLKAAPVVISNKASALLNKRVDWLINDIPSIKEEETSEYINSLIEAFYKLGKPFDIEFPILYAQMPKEWKMKSNKEIAENLEEILNKVELKGEEHPTTYKLRHKTTNSSNIYYTVTRLLSDNIYQNNKLVHSDFIKIRAFWNKDEIAFTFYAPHIIEDKYLIKDTPLFENTPYLNIWHTLWNEAYSINNKIFETRDYAVKYNKQNINYNLDEYLYHTKRSLLIWANYLFSFDLATKLIHQLKEGIYADEESLTQYFSLKETDICYLSGKTLLKTIYDQLNEIIASDKEITLPSVPLEDIQIGNHIPEAYKESYDSKNIQELPKCENMSQLVSTLFFNMHYQVELKGRENWKEDLARLRFGESFSSIYNRGFIRNFHDDIYTSMHKAIDFRIDNGSIVPKYVYKSDNGTNIWARLFRCGENEDLYNQKLIRFMTHVLSNLKDIYGSNLLPLQLIYGTFSIYLLPIPKENIFQGEFLPWDFVCQWKDFGPEVFFLNELGDEKDDLNTPNKQMTNLVSFCISRGLLNETEIKGFYNINQNLPSIIEKDWEKITKEKIEYITKFLTQGMDDLSIQDMIEWLFYSEKVMADVRNKLLEWCNKYSELTDEQIQEYSPIREFNDLNLIYPWKEDKVLIKLKELTATNEQNKGNNQLQNWIESLKDYWEQQVKTISESKNFQLERERGEMMYNLLTCYLNYKNKEYESLILPLAQDLDKYRIKIKDPLSTVYSFEKIINDKDQKAIEKSYKSFIESIMKNIK